MKFKDYTIKRSILDKPNFQFSNTIANCKRSNLYLYVPQKVRFKLGLSRGNQREFRVIIVRKGEVIKNDK